MGTKVTISVPDKLYRQAEAIAKGQNRSIAEVLTESIRLPAQELDSHGDEQDETVAREKAAFIAMHPRLLEKYAGEHVAIHDGRLVDHDADAVALHRQIYVRFPDEFVLIAAVKSQPIDELVFRSPRFE